MWMNFCFVSEQKNKLKNAFRTEKTKKRLESTVISFIGVFRGDLQRSRASLGLRRRLLTCCRTWIRTGSAGLSLSLRQPVQNEVNVSAGREGGRAVERNISWTDPHHIKFLVQVVESVKSFLLLSSSDEDDGLTF